MITQSLLLSMALPALVAGSVLFGAQRMTRGAAASWAASLALAWAWIVGYVTVVGWPPFPPINATQRLVYHVLVASVVLAVVVGRFERARVLASLRAGFSFVLPWLLLRPNIEYRWSTLESVAWVAGLGAVIFVFSMALDAAARRNTGAVTPVAACVAWIGFAVVLVLSGSALLGQLAGACAAALGAAAVFGFVKPDARWTPAGTAILSWVWAGLAINAGFYAEGSPYALVLITLSACAMWFTRRLRDDASSARRILLATGVTTLGAVASVLLAWRT